MNFPRFITPNSLTLGRIALIPLGVYALFKNGGDDYTWQIISWWIFFLLGMTDIYDGKLARSRGQVTELGKFLDPVADKALIGAAMISLAILDRFPWWMVFIILTREIGITIFRLSIVKKGVIAANRGGKIKTLLQNFGVSFYILPLSTSLYGFRDAFMFVAIFLTIATGAYYVRSAFKASPGQASTIR